MKARQTGFTLIELVAVVVLLGILAVAALPRFINLQGDAKAGVLSGLEGSLQSASAQVYAKALMQGSTAATGEVTESGFAAANNIDVVFGYPAAVAAAAKRDITDLVSGIGVDGELEIQNDAAAPLTFVHIGYDFDGDNEVDDDNCYITYTNAANATSAPTISDPALTTAGCQ